MGFVSYSNVFFKGYTDSSSQPAQRSENVVYICYRNTASSFYPDCLSNCNAQMDVLKASKVNNFVYKPKLNSQIASNGLQLPATYVLYFRNGSDKAQFLTRPFAWSDSRSVVHVKLEGQYLGQGDIGFAMHMPNYRSHIAQGDDLIESIEKDLYSFDLDSSIASKTPNSEYFINDFCPAYTLVSGLFAVTCLGSVPPGKRASLQGRLSLLVPCGRNCRECDSMSCTRCEAGFYAVAGSFDCDACSGHCEKCALSPDLCVITPTYFRELAAAVRFYDFQRSGFLAADQARVCWRYHSFLMDSGDRREDLTGGFFDGPGTLKLNFQLSFVVVTQVQTLLYLESEARDSSVHAPLVGTLRRSLEYLLRSYVDDDNLYSHCGIVDQDAAFWGRPEDFDGPRKCFKVPANAPATDLAAAMASALAAGSLLFKTIDADFSEALRAKALSLNRLARSSKRDTLYSAFPELSARYDSNGQFQDELLEASLFLDLLHQDTSSVSARVNEFESHSFDQISLRAWDDKHLSINFLMYKLTGSLQYLVNIESRIVGVLSSDKTAGGLTVLSAESGATDLHPLLMAMFWALVIAKEPSMPNRSHFEDWVKGQADYLLGANPFFRSLQVGVQKNYLSRARHKGSSCPSAPAGCSASAEASPLANPNPVVGAIVKAVSVHDTLDNSRQNPDNQIRLVDNAPVPGILATIFARFGNPNDVDLSLFANPKCDDGPGDYLGHYAFNAAIYGLYLDGELDSPFPHQIRRRLRHFNQSRGIRQVQAALSPVRPQNVPEMRPTAPSGQGRVPGLPQSQPVRGRSQPVCGLSRGVRLVLGLFSLLEVLSRFQVGRFARGLLGMPCELLALHAARHLRCLRCQLRSGPRHGRVCLALGNRPGLSTARLGSTEHAWALQTRAGADRDSARDLARQTPELQTLDVAGTVPAVRAGPLFGGRALPEVLGRLPHLPKLGELSAVRRRACHGLQSKDPKALRAPESSRSD